MGSWVQRACGFDLRREDINLLSSRVGSGRARGFLLCKMSRWGASSLVRCRTYCVAMALQRDSLLTSICHQPGHRRGSHGRGGGAGKCMFPWIQALGTLFFLFLHFCVYSAFISEKLQPASGDRLSPLGVPVTGLSPTDPSITMSPAFSVMRSTMPSSAPHESPTITSDHARCCVSV